MGTKVTGGSPNPPKQALRPQPPCPTAASPEAQEPPASGTSSGSKAGEPDPGPGRGPLLSPPPGAALRPPSAEPDVTVTGGRRGRCASLAAQSPSGQVELGPANRAWKVRKDPALPPLCPARSRSGSIARGLSAASSALAANRLWKRNRTSSSN